MIKIIDELGSKLHLKNEPIIVMPLNEGRVTHRSYHCVEMMVVWLFSRCEECEVIIIGEKKNKIKNVMLFLTLKKILLLRVNCPKKLQKMLMPFKE